MPSDASRAVQRPFFILLATISVLLFVPSLFYSLISVCTFDAKVLPLVPADRALFTSFRSWLPAMPLLYVAATFAAASMLVVKRTPPVLMMTAVATWGVTTLLATYLIWWLAADLFERFVRPVGNRCYLP